MSFTVTERSLYHYLANLLKDLGCESAIEVSTRSGYPDLLVKKGSFKFIVEVKIGEQGLFSGITQIEKNARGAGVTEKILLVYPERVRVFFEHPDEERESKIALQTQLLHGIVLTDFLTENFRDKTPEFLFTELFKILSEKAKVYKPEVAIETLSESVQILANELRKWSGVKLLQEEVVGRMELFSAIGSEGIDENEFRAAAVDLSAYILINQLLFYRIFSKKTGKVPVLSEINKKEDVIKCFDAILKIDFIPIFKIDIIKLLPPSSESLMSVINKIIEILSALKPENMEHDLPGRIFHDLLPPTTRKLLAAFYTRPIAAEIVAGLAVDKYNSQVIDPACGSGTLLVAAYGRKKRLGGDRQNLHREFLEEEITGIDIMPFASHLTAVNLAAQDVEEIANNLKVGSSDSLKLKAGYFLNRLASEISHQMNLLDPDVTPERVNVMEEAKVDTFTVDKFDAVIMNPPFTKQERLPSDYHREVTQKWGSGGAGVGLWGPFMLLANELLKDNGKIGAIIPINFLRGEETRAIRNFFINDKYTWKYLLRSTKNYAFSESSEYSDIIVILEKNNSKENKKRKTGIVLIKKNLKDFALQEGRVLAERIRNVEEEENHSEELFDLYWEDQNYLEENKDNLMPLVSVGSIKNKEVLNEFLEKILKSNKTEKFRANKFAEGFRPVPQGLSDLVFITNAKSPERAMYSNITLEREVNGTVEGKDRTGALIKVPKGFVLKSLRTPVGLKRMDATQDLDYLIIAPYDGLERVSAISNYNNVPNWVSIKSSALRTGTNLAICRRINPYSPSQMHIAYCSTVTFYPSNQLEVVHVKNNEEAKIECLYFNSSLFFVQFMLNKEESTGRRVDIRISDLINIYGLKLDAITEKEKKDLLAMYEGMSNKEFPSLLEQYKQHFEDKKKIDKALFKILGISVSEEELDNVYNVIYEEMIRIKSFSRE